MGIFYNKNTAKLKWNNMFEHSLWHTWIIQNIRKQLGGEGEGRSRIEGVRVRRRGREKDRKQKYTEGIGRCSPQRMKDQTEEGSGASDKPRAGPGSH